MSKTTMSKNEIEQKIRDLKTKLSCQESDIGDWKIAKCIEYSTLGMESPYDLQELHKQRQVIRDEIGALEEELAKCEDEDEAASENQTEDYPLFAELVEKESKRIFLVKKRTEGFPPFRFAFPKYRKYFPKSFVKSFGRYAYPCAGRIHGGMMVDMVEALGATALPIPYADVYSALERGTVDGAENNWPSYEAMNHYEVAKYYTVDEHNRYRRCRSVRNIHEQAFRKMTVR